MSDFTHDIDVLANQRYSFSDPNKSLRDIGRAVILGLRLLDKLVDRLDCEDCHYKDDEEKPHD